MATWNTDKPALANQISDDIPDIEECLQELHDVITAITNGTLGTTEPANFKVDTLGAIAAALNLTSGQVTFPATAVPSADPNTLDDYEEGTWTPDLQFGGAKVGITYDIQVGWYTKIGDLICANLYIDLSSKGVSVGAARVFDYPFTCQNTAGYDAAGSVASLGAVTNLYATSILQNTTNNRMYDAAYLELDNDDFANYSVWTTQISYKI